MKKEDLYLNNDIAYLRGLIIDMINQANSGHPGMAIGSAPTLEVLYKEFINLSTKHPTWINRDRFVLSAGHASSLMYAILHLATNYLTMDDLKKFRQIDSLTPGHPEYHHTLGIDATSGPLGQGIAQAVGLAIAERHLNALLPDKYKDLINHYTYCLCGDGCLEEGISQEALAIASHLKLNRLILIYDKNDVTLDGPLALSSDEEVLLRFKALKWNIINLKNLDPSRDEISKAIKKAKKSLDRPTLDLTHTTIGLGSTHQGTNKVHGSPLGYEDGLKAKKSYNYPDYDKEFYIPEEVYRHYHNLTIKRGNRAYHKWEKLFKELKIEHPDIAKILSEGDKASYIKEQLVNLNYDENPSGKEATRKDSQQILTKLFNLFPNLIGGSADVAGSVLTKVKGQEDFNANNYAGTNINYGIREFAMAAINNGILLHGALRSYGGCFLIFSDYLKPAIRLAALSKLPAIYLFSHDSIALGEDGPTHQPIEQLAMLRSIPNVNVYRPMDGYEVMMSYQMALLSEMTPSVIVLSRQALPYLGKNHLNEMRKGAYILKRESAELKLVVIASGSEVSLAYQAIIDNPHIRLVSMLSTNVFDKQDEAYQKEVLGEDYNRRVYIEMLSSYGLYKYAKHVISYDHYGMSGKEKDNLLKAGFVSEVIAKKILALVE